MKKKSQLTIERITKKIKRNDVERNSSSLSQKLLTYIAKHSRSFDEVMGWRWSLNNLWCDLVQVRVENFFYWLKTTVQYSRFLWNNGYDWDYSSMLNLLRFKLQRKYDFFMSDKTSIEEHQKVADQIKEVIDLIDKYQSDSFTEEEVAAHEEKWGERKIGFDRNPVYDKNNILLGYRVGLDIPNVKTEEDREKEQKERYEITKLDWKRKKECWNAIWDKMKKSNWWWD